MNFKRQTEFVLVNGPTQIAQKPMLCAVDLNWILKN